MADPQVPVIFTKHGCERCKILKEWMNAHNVKYIEKDVGLTENQRELGGDPDFVRKYCDEEGCLVNTPLVYYKKNYYFKELWSPSIFLESAAKKMFGVK